MLKCTTQLTAVLSLPEESKRGIATISLMGARRDVHQDTLMAGWLREKEMVFFGGGTVFKKSPFPLLLTQSIVNLQSDVRN